MKPKEVSSIVFIEDSVSSSSSFLLQGALHFAEQGFTVCVISTKRIQSLPPPVHGVVMPGAEVFGLIRFLYLLKWQDLLQHLYSIHLHALVPSVIILESAEHYFHPKEDGDSRECETVNFDVQHASLIFASLIDAVAVCGTILKKRAWYVKTEPADDDCSMDTVVLTSQHRKHQLRFSQGKDLPLILKEIINFEIS